MVLAVDHGDAHVLQLIAGDRAVLQHLAHALFHCRQELVGDGAALDRIDELEAAAARQGLDAQEHLAELPGTAGLLLVAVVAVGRCAHRLAVGDARRARLHLHAVALLHALQGQLQVQVGQPAHHALVELAVVLDAEAGVLFVELGQRGGEFLLLSLVRRLHCQTEHGPGEIQRLEVDLVLVVGIVQHSVEMDLVHLGHGGDVAGYGLVDLDVLLAAQLEQVAHLEWFLAVVDEQLGVAPHRALVDTEHAELAHEGIVDDLEHVGDDVPGRIGFGGNGCGVGAGTLDEGWRIAFLRIGRQALDQLQQFLDPGARACRDEAHRHQVPLAQALFEGVVQFLPG